MFFFDAWLFIVAIAVAVVVVIVVSHDLAQSFEFSVSVCLWKFAGLKFMRRPLTRSICLDWFELHQKQKTKNKIK